MSSNDPKTITRTALTTLTEDLQRYAVIRQMLDDLEAEKRSLEASILDTAELNHLGTGQILAGVTLTVRKKFEYSEAEALAWSTDPTRLPLMPSVLSVSKEQTARIVQLAVTDPTLTSVFELNKSGFEKALQSGQWVDAPSFQTTETVGLTFSSKNFKARDVEIEAQFQSVIEDATEGGIDSAVAHLTERTEADIEKTLQENAKWTQTAPKSDTEAPF